MAGLNCSFYISNFYVSKVFYTFFNKATFEINICQKFDRIAYYFLALFKICFYATKNIYRNSYFLWSFLCNFCYNCFDFSVSFQTIFSKFSSRSWFFISTKRLSSIKGIVAIDPHRSSPESMWQIMCLVEIGSEYTRS